MYLALWLIRRWRLPATPCLILPVAVSLKRFFTPLLVLSLGISSPFALSRHSEQPRQPLRPGGSILPTSWKAGAYMGSPLKRQGALPCAAARLHSAHAGPAAQYPRL